MKITICPDAEEFHSTDMLGAVYLWLWNGKTGRLMIRLPSGAVSGIHIKVPSEPHPPDVPCWDVVKGILDGKLQPDLTLTPSINCTGINKWHGYLTNGELVEC